MVFFQNPSKKFKQGNPIDNTYNTEPGKKSSSVIVKVPSGDDANITKQKAEKAAKRKRSKKRGRKNKKRRRNGKKRRRKMKTNKKRRKNVPSPAVNIKVQLSQLKSMDLIVL